MDREQMIEVLPSRVELERLLSYNPHTGELTWRSRGSLVFDNRYEGRVALAARDAKGYKHGMLNSSHAKSHRVIWKMMTGTEPEQVDHINGDKGDNRWINLRSVSNAQNQKNTRLPSNNRSGVIGVSQRGDSGKWRAQIANNGKKIPLGTFDSKADAIAARKAAERKYGFHPNHGRPAMLAARPK